MFNPKLTSLQNPRIKALVKLMHHSSERRQSGTFVLEGAREICRALNAGVKALEAFVVPELFSAESNAAVKALAGLTPTEITRELFAKVALRETKDGLLVVFQAPAHPSADALLKEVTSEHPPFYLAVQGVEKPGNLGALLRSADGAGVSGVLIVVESDDPKADLGLDLGVDLYHPQLMRNSLGAVFSLKIAVINIGDLPRLAGTYGLSLVAAALTPAAISLHKVDLSAPLIAMVGSEAQGLNSALIEHADVTVQIPMKGICDSLNVATAGAILIYEILRQRSD